MDSVDMPVDKLVGAIAILKASDIKYGDSEVHKQVVYLLLGYLSDEDMSKVEASL